MIELEFDGLNIINIELSRFIIDNFPNMTKYTSGNVCREENITTDFIQKLKSRTVKEFRSRLNAHRSPIYIANHQLLYEELAKQKSLKKLSLYVFNVTEDKDTLNIVEIISNIKSITTLKLIIFEQTDISGSSLRTWATNLTDLEEFDIFSLWSKELCSFNDLLIFIQLAKKLKSIKFRPSFIKNFISFGDNEFMQVVRCQQMKERNHPLTIHTLFKIDDGLLREFKRIVKVV